MKRFKRFLPTSFRRGSVLAYTLILLSVVLLSAIGIATVSVTNERGSLLSSRSVSSFQVADTGSQAAIVAIREALSSDSSAKLSDLTIGSCSSGSIQDVPSGTVGSYTLTFEDKDGNVLNCGSDLSEVSTVKSVGVYRDTSRAVKVAVAQTPALGITGGCLLSYSGSSLISNGWGNGCKADGETGGGGCNNVADTNFECGFSSPPIAGGYVACLCVSK